jgi:NAD(P)-dependent dehydrogenase (short-subunit alcohol dehydrogenase family)
MAKIFITGSADGLGLLAAQALVEQGHKVALHARNHERKLDALNKVPSAEKVFIADLSNIEETKNLAQEVNDFRRFDAVIHNAGVYQATASQILKVNTLAPYILTCLMHKPKRLIYLSSGMHLQGQPNFEQLRKDTSRLSYSDSKLHVVILSMAFARLWPDVFSNAVDPGWVATKMGGKSAPDNLQKGYETQVWLAVGEDEKAKVSGRYFYHQKEKYFNTNATDVDLQDKLLDLCRELTDVSLP